MTPHPYNQVRLTNGRILREFRGDVESDDLVWHQDRLDREITIVKSNGWKLQLEEGLPFDLHDGSTYKIPARSWHRIIKGHGDLMIEIVEFDSKDIINTGKRRDHA